MIGNSSTRLDHPDGHAASNREFPLYRGLSVSCNWNVRLSLFVHPSSRYRAGRGAHKLSCRTRRRHFSPLSSRRLVSHPVLLVARVQEIYTARGSSPPLPPPGRRRSPPTLARTSPNGPGEILRLDFDTSASLISAVAPRLLASAAGCPAALITTETAEEDARGRLVCYTLLATCRT